MFYLYILLSATVFICSLIVFICSTVFIRLFMCSLVVYCLQFIGPFLHDAQVYPAVDFIVISEMTVSHSGIDKVPISVIITAFFLLFIFCSYYRQAKSVFLLQELHYLNNRHLFRPFSDKIRLVIGTPAGPLIPLLLCTLLYAAIVFWSVKIYWCINISPQSFVHANENRKFMFRLRPM